MVKVDLGSVEGIDYTHIHTHTGGEEESGVRG